MDYRHEYEKISSMFLKDRGVNGEFLTSSVHKNIDIHPYNVNR
jgi:hypothetical protein